MIQNINDFHFVRQGKTKGYLTEENQHLLDPVSKKIHSKKKKALLLLHGFTSTPAVFRILIPQLMAFDAVFAPALPGHATNLEDFSRTSHQDWTSFVETTYHAIKKDYEHVEVLGLSLGGLLAYRLSQTVTLDRLILLAPACYLSFSSKSYIPFINLMEKVGFFALRNGGGDIYGKRSDLVYRTMPLYPLQELFSLIEATDIHPPACPTELILGEHDKVVDNRKIMKDFKSSHITVHMLEHSAHVLPIDNDIDELATIINNYYGNRAPNHSHP